MPNPGAKPIAVRAGSWVVPDHPVIPCLDADAGPEAARAARRILDGAVLRAYGGRRRLEWAVLAPPALRPGEAYPGRETVRSIERHRVLLCGPFAPTPGPSGAAGGEDRGKALRRALGLGSRYRAICSIPGLPTRGGEALDVALFFDAPEVDAPGLEWSAGPAARRLSNCVRRALRLEIPPADAAIAVRHASRAALQRVVRRALEFALSHGRPGVTLVHRAAAAPHLEGLLVATGRDIIRREYAGRVMAEEEIEAKWAGTPPTGMLVLRTRSLGRCLEDLARRPDSHGVVAATGETGGVLDDVLSALAGGADLVAGAAWGPRVALFEAAASASRTEGDGASPIALALAGALLLDHLGWPEAAESVRIALRQALAGRVVPADLAGRAEGLKPVKCSEFTETVVQNIPSPFSADVAAAAPATGTKAIPPSTPAKARGKKASKAKGKARTRGRRRR